MTTTLSPPIRILGIVGILAAAGLGLLLFMQSRSSHSNAATPVVGTLHSSTRTPTVKPAATNPVVKPATPAVPKIVLLPGLPAPIAHALRYSKVVVVSLYAGGAGGDMAALDQARAGASSAHAGFAALNVLDEQLAKKGLDKFVGTASSPAVLIVRRPGKIVNQFAGYADSDLVAQAAQNAGAGR